MEKTWIRIKRSVKPYGGRKAEVKEFYTYPGGKTVVLVFAPISTNNYDIREYTLDEVDVLSADKTVNGYQAWIEAMKQAIPEK